MRVLLAGGGTAGHINPAIAIAKYISSKNKNCEILFIGTKEGMEKKLVPKEGFKINFINVKGFKRKLCFDTLITIKELFKGIIQSRKIIKQFKPDVVIGTGGYVCGPVIINAYLMKIPTLIHEQNVFPGMTIKILSNFVDCVATSFEETKKYLKVKNKLVLVGNPIRQEILNTDKLIARQKLKLDSRPFIVAFGGSLGADKINNTLIEYIRYIYKSNNVQLLLGTGERQYEYVKSKLKSNGVNLKKYNNIKVVPYIYNIGEVMSAADLLICRAGAITISEITAMGKPSILIPSPNVTNNHQEYNARALEKNGAAIVLEENNLDGKILNNQIEILLKDKISLRKMSKNSAHMGITNAVEKIYNIILELCN